MYSVNLKTPPSYKPWRMKRTPNQTGNEVKTQMRQTDLSDSYWWEKMGFLCFKDKSGKSGWWDFMSLAADQRLEHKKFKPWHWSTHSHGMKFQIKWCSDKGTRTIQKSDPICGIRRLIGENSEELEGDKFWGIRRTFNHYLEVSWLMVWHRHQAIFVLAIYGWKNNHFFPLIVKGGTPCR